MGIGKQTVVGRIELGSFVFIFNDESEQNKKSSILRPGVTSRRTSPETISLSHYLCILWGRCQQITALGPKSSPLTVSVNKVLLEHGDVHLCTAGALEQNICNRTEEFTEPKRVTIESKFKSLSIPILQRLQ